MKTIFIICALLMISNSVLASWSNFRQNSSNNALKNILIREVSLNYNRRPWSFQTDGLVWGTPIGGEGTIFVGSASKKFFALNEANGTKQWQYQIFDRADSLIDSAAAMDESMVVIPGGDGFLHAVDKNTGERKWVFKAHHQSDEGHQEGHIVNSFEGNVTLGPNGHFYAGSDNGHMYCVDKNGKEVWSLKTDMMIWSSPAFFNHKKLMAFGSLDRHLYLVNYETGKVIQKINLSSEVKSSPAIIDDQLYVGTSGGMFLNFKLREGKLNLRWSHEVRGEIYSSPVVIEDHVVFGSLNGFVYGLNTRNGKKVWEFDTYSSVSSSPVGTRDGVVIFGSKNGKLYALDAASGKRIWSFKTSNNQYKVNLDSSPMITDRGSIVVGSYNGNIYRIPYEYCFNFPLNGECEFGGERDIPDFVEALADGDHFLYLKRNGDYISADKLEVKRSAIIKLKYVSVKNGDLEKNKALSPVRLKVWINGTRYKNTRVSADGKFLNLIAPTQGWGPGIKHIKVRFGTYERKSWLSNRLNIYFKKKSEKNFVFNIKRNRLEGEAQEKFHQFYRELVSGKKFLGVKNLFLFQPSSLETYIPAAMDGQQFIIRFFELNSKDIEIGTKLGAIAVPATFSNGEFTPLAETARLFNLNVSIIDSHFLMSNPFYLSAMGGGINFSESLFEYTFGSPMGNFYASASCLKIKGNGESYRFPMEVIDNTCDHKLRISALGKMNVTREILPQSQNRARVRFSGKKMRVTMRKKLQEDKTISVVYLQGSEIKRVSQVIKKGERGVLIELKDKNVSVYKIFLNADELRI